MVSAVEGRIACESSVSMTRSGFQVYQDIFGDRRFEGLGGPWTSRIDCDKPLGWMSCRVAGHRSRVAGRSLRSVGRKETDLVLKRLLRSQVLVPWGGLGVVCGITMSLLRLAGLGLAVNFKSGRGRIEGIVGRLDERRFASLRSPRRNVVFASGSKQIGEGTLAGLDPGRAAGSWAGQVSLMPQAGGCSTYATPSATLSVPSTRPNTIRPLLPRLCPPRLP